MSNCISNARMAFNVNALLSRAGPILTWKEAEMAVATKMRLNEMMAAGERDDEQAPEQPPIDGRDIPDTDPDKAPPPSAPEKLASPA